MTIYIAYVVIDTDTAIGYLALVLLVVAAPVFIIEDKSDPQDSQHQSRISKVRAAAARPLSIIQSPILWVGLLSVGVIAFVFFKL
jgi:hypothetical protein